MGKKLWVHLLAIPLKEIGKSSSDPFSLFQPSSLNEDGAMYHRGSWRWRWHQCPGDGRAAARGSWNDFTAQSCPMCSDWNIYFYHFKDSIKPLHLGSWLHAVDPILMNWDGMPPLHYPATSLFQKTVVKKGTNKKYPKQTKLYFHWNLIHFINNKASL